MCHTLIFFHFSLQRRPIYDIFPPVTTKEEEDEKEDEETDEDRDRDGDGDEEEEVDDSGKFSPSSPPVSAKVSRRAIITKSTKDSGKVEFTTEDQWFSKERLYKVMSEVYV